MAGRELGALLRERRTAVDVTRRELAVAAGIDASAVAAIEREGRTRASTVRRLADALADLAADNGHERPADRLSSGHERLCRALDGPTLAAELVAAAGDDIAPEPVYPEHAERIERRRDRRAAPARARALVEIRRAHRLLDDALAADDMDAAGRIIAKATGRPVDLGRPSPGGGS